MRCTTHVLTHFRRTLSRTEGLHPKEMQVVKRACAEHRDVQTIISKVNHVVSKDAIVDALMKSIPTKILMTCVAAHYASEEERRRVLTACMHSKDRDELIRTLKRFVGPQISHVVLSCMLTMEKHKMLKSSSYSILNGSLALLTSELLPLLQREEIKSVQSALISYMITLNLSELVTCLLKYVDQKVLLKTMNACAEHVTCSAILVDLSYSQR